MWQERVNAIQASQDEPDINEYRVIRTVTHIHPGGQFTMYVGASSCVCVCVCVCVYGVHTLLSINMLTPFFNPCLTEMHLCGL